MKIVCLGDSLTFGFGVSRTHCWTSILERDYNITIINKGINGDTTGGMLARFHQDVLSHKPDMVFLMGGANDIFTSGTSSHARSNIASLVQQSLAACIKPVLCIGVPIIVSQIPSIWKSLTDFSVAETELLSYYAWLHTYARTFSVPCVDFYHYFADIDEATRISYYLDGLHMNQAGHIQMAQCIKDCNLLK